MHPETQRAHFIIWIFIFLSLAVGAGAYWFWSGEYQGQAAEKINASKETVMTNTLIGYWTLDGNNIVWGDTTSEIKDVNPGTKHHGNSTNLAAGSAVPGRTGQGLLFNGSSDTVSLGNVYNGVKTVAFWVKPNTTTQSLIDLNAAATVDINAGTVRGNNFTTPTIYVDGVATTTFPDTEWHHIAVTTGTGVNASAAYIGQIASSYFGGTIDDIRFYSDALTATQVADLYRATSAKEVSNANHRESLANGLVGYWTFDGRDTKWSDTSTEIKDISGSGNHGNALGSLATTSVTPGKLGQGLSFNGTSDYVNLNQPSSLNFSGSFTLSAWVKLSGLPVADSDYVIVERRSIYGNFEFSLLFTTYYSIVNKFGVIASLDGSRGSSDAAARYSAIAGTTGQWYHVVGVFDTSARTLHMYLNGSLNDDNLDGTVPASTEVSSNGDSLVTIGDSLAGDSRYFNGTLDDVRIYNRVLSETEITNLYNVGR